MSTPDLEGHGPLAADARLVVVRVPGINRAVVQAVNFGCSIADDVRAVLGRRA